MEERGEHMSRRAEKTDWTAAELRTARLSLRPLRAEDWPAVAAYACDRENAAYMIYYPMESPEAVRRYVAQKAAEWEKEQPSVYEFAVWLGADLIGTVTLWMEESEYPELGWILDRRFWGRGYGGEAVQALKEFAVRTLGLTVLEASCDTRNAASARVMEKAGLPFYEERDRVYESRDEKAREWRYLWKTPHF